MAASFFDLNDQLRPSKWATVAVSRKTMVGRYGLSLSRMRTLTAIWTRLDVNTHMIGYGRKTSLSDDQRVHADDMSGRNRRTGWFRIQGWMACDIRLM